MKLFLIACILALASAKIVTVGAFDELVSKVNAANTTWIAEAPTHRFGSLHDVKKLCGTWTKEHPKYIATNLTRAPEDMNPLPQEAIPTDFDARTAWPKCTVISKVRDQSSCGSCWAFGSTEAFEDSRCIATGEDKEFSTADTAGCCSGLSCGFSQGCNGGQPSAALQWMTRQGVVTGGDYEDLTSSTGGCLPYAFGPCAHHVPASAKYPKCPEEEYRATCTRQCSNTASGLDYDSDKTKGAKSYTYETAQGMQTAIMTTGPLAVAFTVYADFPTYKSGVYTHVSGSRLGGHAVEMIGWGVEGTTPYWLIKNSWNPTWGDGGTFKILRGSDECGIEDDVTGIKF